MYGCLPLRSVDRDAPFRKEEVLWVMERLRAVATRYQEFSWKARHLRRAIENLDMVYIDLLADEASV
jgi:hypothetical protein